MEIKLSVEVNVYHHGHEEARETKETLARIEGKLATVVAKQGAEAMALQDIKDAVAAEKTVVQSVVVLINALADKLLAASGDADTMAQIASDIKLQTSSLAAAVVAGTGVLNPPPVVVPLASSYLDRASFDTAVAAYTGPEEVDVDGVVAKAGTLPALAYATQADGSITKQ